MRSVSSFADAGFSRDIEEFEEPIRDGGFAAPEMDSDAGEMDSAQDADSSEKPAWRIDVVDGPPGEIGITSHSLAVGPQDNLHVAYGGERLYHSRWDGSAWDREIVDDITDAGGVTTIAADSSGTLHIGYTVAYDQALMYATNPDGRWEYHLVEVLQAGYPWAKIKSAVIAVAPRGVAHLAYVVEGDYRKKGLKHATLSPGELTVETLESGGPFYGIAAAADSRGNVYVMFADGGREQIDLATLTDSGRSDTQFKDLAGSFNSVIEGSVAVAVDADDTVHVAYILGDKLFHADSRTGLQTVEVVTRIGPNNVAMATEPRGVVHLSHGKDALYYTSNGSGVWLTELVATDVADGITSAIAATTKGRAHLAAHYFEDVWDRRAPALFHIEITPEGSKKDWIEMPGGAGRYPSLAVAPDGSPRISYCGPTAEGRRFAELSATGWTVSHVDLTPGDCGPGVLVSAEGGERVVLYSSAREESVKYARLSAKGWTTEKIDRGPVSDLSASAEPSGRIHLCYNSYSSGLVHTSGYEGNWSVEQIPASPGIDLTGLSCVAGPDGQLHVAIASSEEGLQHMKKGPEGWATETVVEALLPDGLTSWPSIPDLAMDRNGFLHVAYRCATCPGGFGGVGYSTNRSGSWESVAVYSPGSERYVGAISIAIDPAGDPHVTYCVESGTSCSLMLASRVLGHWENRTVDASPDLGYYASAEYDQWGWVHIGYYDEINGALRYATDSPRGTGGTQ
jgi:hypothetical protein